MSDPRPTIRDPKDALTEYVEGVYFDGILMGAAVGFACGLALAIGVYGGLKSRS